MSLYLAISTCDVKIVKNCLERGDCANQLDGFGKSYFRKAVCCENLEIVKLLVQHGAKCGMDEYCEIDEFHHAIFLCLEHISFYLFVNGNQPNVDSNRIVDEEKLLARLTAEKNMVNMNTQNCLKLMKLFIVIGEQKKFKLPSERNDTMSLLIDALYYRVFHNHFRNFDRNMLELILIQDLVMNDTEYFESVLYDKYGTNYLDFMAKPLVEREETKKHQTKIIVREVGIMLMVKK